MGTCGFLNLRGHRQRHASYTKATPPNLSQTVPATVEQAFKQEPVRGMRAQMNTGGECCIQPYEVSVR